MSHLSILPTVLRDIDLLASSLEALGYLPRRGGFLQGFADEREPVDLLVDGDGVRLGWRRLGDGSLALVGDLQRLSHSSSVQTLLSRITRCYATALALQQAGLHFEQAQVCFGF